MDSNVNPTKSTVIYLISDVNICPSEVSYLHRLYTIQLYKYCE